MLEWVDRIRASAFIPDKELWLSPDGQRLHARGKLADYLRHLIWDFVSDGSPSCYDTLDAVHNLSRRDWQESPAQAIADIDQLTAHWRLAEEQSKDRPEEWQYKPRGVWLAYAKAATLFLRYHAALVKMGLAEQYSGADTPAVVDQSPSHIGGGAHHTTAAAGSRS